MSSGSTSAISSTGSAAATSSPIAAGSTGRTSMPVSAPAALGFGGEVVPDQDQLGSGITHVVLDLARGQQHVHRHDDRAEPERGVVDHREVGDVGQHHADPVAPADALARQQSRDTLADLLHRGVGDGDVVEPDRDAVRVLRGGFGQKAGEIRVQRAASPRNGCCPHPRARDRPSAQAAAAGSLEDWPPLGNCATWTSKAKWRW